MTSRAFRPRATLAAALLAASVSAQAAIPSFEQVKAAYRSSETVLLDRHGQPVQVVRTDLKARRGAWVPLAQVSPALRAAAIASEDQRFTAHGGVDWQAVAGAAIGRANPGGTRGASTITMQLAGLLDPDLAQKPGGRSVGTKIEQAAAALRIERTWSKDQILEAWLNLVPFRGEQVGVAAMSQALFQKAPSGLNAEESAIAAALLRAPNAAPAVVGQRACGVLKQQGRGDACVAAQGFAELVLAHPASASPDAGEQLAPHFARQLVKPGAKSPPATLRTTLDAGTQRRAREALRQQLAELRDRDVEDGAVVVLDNATGDVLAWVGSSGDLSQAAAVDAVVAPRQAGSTLKPFLYEQAIEQRWLTAASVLDDAPTRLHTPSGLYIPQNYDHDFKGPVSVRTALGSSLNVPAVRTAVIVSPDRFARRLVALGLPIRKPGDFYGYSIALGSPEVTLLSLANAYRSLANGGVVSPPRLQPADGAPAATRVMAAAPSFVVADILADNNARVPTFGLDNALATRYWSAVKTGTSKDMRDNWCVGFSARYTVGVWVGNASGAPMHAVSGVTGAAPVWRTVMDALQRSDVATEHPGRIVPAPGHRGAPARDARASAGGLFQVAYAPGATPGAAPGAPTPPDGLVAQAITFDGQVEAPRTEWFIAGTETARVALASPVGSAARRIASPDDQSVIALDPDMPPAVQRLRFEAVAPVPAGAWWRLDGKRVGAAGPLSWAPWPGHHELALVDAQGHALDGVSFDVRGAQARPAGPPVRKPARVAAAASRPGA